MGVLSSWKNKAGGPFGTAGDWSGGAVPGATTDADLPALGVAYTVTSSTNETVDFLEVDPNATLNLTGGVFTVFGTSAWYSNAYLLGTIHVGAGATLNFGEAGSPSGDSAEINGSGTLNIGSTGALARLQVLAPWMGLFNGATVALSGNAQIGGATTGGGNTLENKNGTISGSGQIGNGAGATGGNGLILLNDHNGVINANGAAALVLNTGANAIGNQGLLENTGTGGLTIASLLYQDGRLLDTGTGALTLDADVEGLGTLTVAKGAVAVLNIGGISLNGVITVASGGKIATTSGNTAAVGANNAYVGDVLSGTIENAGTIAVANNSTLNLNASVYNSGAGGLSLAGSTLEVFNNGASVYGGTVTLSNSAQNLIDSNLEGQQLSDYATINGAGTIGDSWLRLYVAPTGVVNADDSVGLTIVGDSSAVAAGSESSDYSAGTVETTGAGGLTIGGAFGNAGYLIASGAGALTLNGAQVSSGGGVVETIGSGSVVLDNNAAISHQAYLSISSGGKVGTTSGDSLDVLEDKVLNNGTVTVANNSTLVVDDHWTGAGAVDLNGSTAATGVDIAAGQIWTLLGGGTIVLGGAENSILSGPGASSTNGATLNNRGDTIEGSGVIGDASMTINNAVGATIDATGPGGLTLNSAPFNATTSTTFLNNGGTIQSDSAAGLTIDTAIYNAGALIADAGSKIVAKGAVYGGGVTDINGSGSVEFAATADNDVHFGGGSGGTLILDNYGAPNATSPFYGNVYGLAAGDSIDLRDFAYASGHMALGANASFGTLDGGLSVSNGTQTSSYLFLQGNYSAAYLSANNLAWSFTSDGHQIGTTGQTGTEITLVSVKPV
ncbi:hypothetical protein DFR50_12657 [Roseiarcus fermentans]|uniref:Uncharacterized protein n=1 Tax=Roseiarcus fermentans TaxID=1473586 RepID=A0A366F0M0_9HYPH|nr:hypothetical protein [Roseiarcus fermentans]RBP08212.1 hypothetical protein DFR50_12657 [Roseiarcus fermentans]